MIKNKIRQFICNMLGWHVPIVDMYIGQCNSISKCRYCGKVIAQDSQGNWFALNK